MIGNLFKKLVVLNIKSSFTCGESNSLGKIVNFKVKDIMSTVVDLTKSLKKPKKKITKTNKITAS